MSDKQLRLLAVHAHPDDESSKGAATLAYYQEQGVEVTVVSCTGGELGDILNIELQDNPGIQRDITGHRRQEMAQAASILKIQHRWLGYTDSGFPENFSENPTLPLNSFASIPIETAALPLVKIIREFRPQVLISYDTSGGYPHPDHIMANKISVAAYELASQKNFFPQVGNSWQISKFYYECIFNLNKFTTLHKSCIELGIESPYERFIEFRKEISKQYSLPNITTKIECGQYFPIRDAALKSHKSQIPEDSFFFNIPIQLQQQIWPWEEYSLVSSTIESTSTIEEDLFAGLR